MTETLDLAKRHEFSFAQTNVRPSLRVIAGPLGSSTVEPRVMQVLLALHDAEGAVLSRDQLLERCWGGVIVGDDAINRTIAEIRRVVKETGAQFEIETIPRVGYRIVGSEGGEPVTNPPRASQIAIDRRKLIAAGAATMAVTVGGGAAVIFSRRDSEVDALIAEGRSILAVGTLDAERRASRIFERAIEQSPERADAWGWFARSQENGEQARAAASRAVELDPDEPNGRTVLILQRKDLISWVEWEDALLEILDRAPDNTLVLDHISHFYQNVGRCKDNWRLGERLFRLEPDSPGNQHRRAYRHWMFGKIAEADKIIDKSLRLWPRHPWVWNGRLLIYAFTDRAKAAMSLLEDVESRPLNLTTASVEFWRAALRALDTRSSEDIRNAIEVCTKAAILAPGLAVNAIMTFSHIGELDQAYRVADGIYLGRGSIVQKLRGAGIRDTYSGAGWGRTQALFIPASANFRADKRFTDLCRQMGHVAYWEERGIWPDPFVRGSLEVPA